MKIYSQRFIRLHKKNNRPAWMAEAVWVNADMQLDIILKLHEGRC